MYVLVARRKKENINMNNEITEIETFSTARILDSDENEWTAGYLMVFRRLKTVEFLKSIIFNNNVTTYTSPIFLSVPYSKFLLMIELEVSGSPTDILIEIEMSDGSGIWYKYMTGPFGDLRYATAGGNKKECIDGDVRAHYFRAKVTATGTDASNTFKMSLKTEFASM